MSQNSFDDAVLSRFEDGASKHQDNGITINSLTAGDFKDYNNLARRTDPISSAIDTLTVYDIPGVQIKGRGGLTARPDDYIGIIELKPVGELKPRPTMITDIGFGTSDTPSRYPLPMEAVTQAGETALEQLNQRIINKAVAKVQESMTPSEKHELNKDAAKYAEQMREYEKQMSLEMMMKLFHRRPEDWPKPPEKPKSMVKYEEAIDREIERAVRRLSA